MACRKERDLLAEKLMADDDEFTCLLKEFEAKRATKQAVEIIRAEVAPKKRKEPTALTPS